ncbi:MAG: hypothetical protein B7Y36_11315 [Novosphingobium sp. 28-62-57]|uniref:hypothetical protein n=1 Tax=Novosphingobium sp. 28-62-57 TaxID=1970409 RepID=UPI000BC58D3E|nr:hypothetical protein [Novosphingobium sp. 28-62-57]OYW50897.1 MAG: hypothetical protein B7Z34_03520 [Novosphingobium sp. 12-62-10]OYZ09965.1 MAG: hypothetical protein B7Y36_11315 [Novosphingobium sp. 28-62-57]HQS69648.1 hypothetical protein [Novosphingobium sp.]
MAGKAQDDAQASALTPGKGLVVLAIVIVAVAAFIAVSAALGLAAVFGGFLFAFYFTGLCHAAPDKFLPASVGAFVGMGIAFALMALPASFGTAGMIAALIVVLGAVYALIMGWAPMAINHATMLFLTVGTIPALQQRGTLAEMALSAGLAVGLIGAALAVARVRASKAV